VFKTPFGYKLRMIGSNMKFARYGGIDTKKTIILVFAISGVFGALAGAHLTMGIQHCIITNISISMAFEGIIVAILARNNPLYIRSPLWRTLPARRRQHHGTFFGHVTGDDLCDPGAHYPVRNC
jgi:ribose/xylose/arabinose/galactoside ABC-type transport system permease subunit